MFGRQQTAIPAGASARNQEPGNFNAATRQNFVLGSPVSLPSGSTGNVVLTTEVPSIGYLGAVNLFLEGTVNTGVGGSTTVSATQYPLAPYAFIKRIRLYNTNNVDLFSISGYGAYLLQGTDRTHFESAVVQAGQYNPFTPAPFASYFDAPAAIGASATDTWSCMLRLEVAWGNMLRDGLQLLQDPSIKYLLEITFGTLSDLYATNAVATFGSVSVTPEYEIYQLPQREIDQPALNFAKVVLEDIQTSGFVAGGNLQYKLVTGNMLLRVIHELAQGSPLQPFSPANITSSQINYAQVQVPYNTRAPFSYWRQRRIYGKDMPAGVICHELQSPNGFPELPGARDIINLAELTDANSLIGIASGAPLTNPQLRTVRVQLAANR